MSDDPSFDNPLRTAVDTFEEEGSDKDVEQNFGGLKEENVVRYTSMFCFKEENKYRHSLNAFMNTKAVDSFLLGCILLNVFILALQSPTNTMGSTWNKTFDIIDAILSVIFSLEMCIRIFCLGFCFGPTTYMQNGWNRLDFIVVMGIWVDALIRVVHALTSTSGEGVNINYLRTLRALRPLRSLRFFSGIKIIIECLGSGMQLLANVAGLMTFVFVLMACMGPQLFMGATTVKCANTPAETAKLTAVSLGNASAACNGPETTAGWDITKCPPTFGSCPNGCVSRPYANYTGNPDYDAWTVEIFYQGFDNVGATMLTLFVVSTFDEWPEFSDKVRRADLDASGVAWIYFALVVALAGLLVANLFIAVITIAYGRAADIEEAVSDYEKIDPMAAVDDDEAAPETPVTWCPFIAGVSPQLRTLVTHGFFEGFIMVIVVLNTISMASEHYGQSEDFTHTLHITEIIFVTIYCIEITLKWFGLGFKEYFSSGFNCLDFGVVVISLLGFMLSAVDGFQVFRIVRMLRLTRVTRLLRLLKRYDSVMNLLRTVMGSWTAIANVSFFIIVMHVVFGVMGIHMIGNNPSQGWEPPRENFHDFWRAVMSVFQVFTGEDWSVLMFGYMRSHGSWCCLYFLLVFSVMNFVCDSLFVAVILENFETAEAEKMGKQKKLYEKALALKAEQEAKPDEVALLLEAPEEPLPEKPRPTDCSDAKALVERKSFENFIIVIILMSSVCLAIEGPANATYLKGKDGLVTTLHVLDVLFFLIFWVECLLKIAAYGFLGYIQDGWSRLDFFVVVMTTVDVVAQAVSSDSAAGWARIFRVFRVLRPLRVASKFENIRVIVDALVSSIGAVSATLFLAAFFFVVFAILGTNMFMGRFQICTADESLNKADCVALAGNGTSTWSNREMHFDDIFSSLQTLFMVSTSEGWVTIMNWAVDSADKDSGAAPVYNGYQWYAVFFILFIFFAKFFITNLFVGVLVQHFQESSGSSLLTEAQTKWSRFEMLCLMTKMQGDNREELKEVEKSSVKKTFYPIVKSNIFETVVLVTIIGNVVLLLAEHWPGSGDWESFLDIMNFIFLVVFTVEIFMQILAIGLGGYFKNDWNKLDFFIVFFSWLFTFIGVAVGVQAGRGVRMLRVLLVLKSAMTVRGIVMTLILSIAPAINVAAALFLVIFVYGIAGMHFYGDYANCDDNRLNDLNNFSNIFNAMMILFQISTGMDWMSIMDDLRARPNPPSVLFSYFSSFYIISIFVFVNLFVAVLLENFEREFNDTEELDVSSDDLVDLRKNFLSFLDKLEEAGRLPRGDTPARICARLQALQQQAGLYVSRRRAGPIALAAPPNCFNKKTLNILTVRNVKEYVLQLPDQSPFAVCRQVNEDLWYNRLLHELGHIPAEVHGRELEGSGGVRKRPSTSTSTRLPDGWERRTVDDTVVFVNHKLKKTTMDDPWKLTNVLDSEVEFTDLARTLCLLRQSVMEGRVDGGFESLTYAEAKERSEKLDAQREKAALMLITVCVRANMAKANPPADLLAKEGWTLQEYKTKVNFARWFMINTCVKAEKVG